MKLQNEFKLDIPVSEMKDGEIGIITMWGVTKHHIGLIVQRYSNSLIALQKPYGDSFTGIAVGNDYRVHILQKGEILIIE